MKKLIYIVAVLLLTAVAHGSPVDADDDLGLGIIAGSDTGVTGKKWIDARRAVDFTFAAGANDESQVHADYLWHFQAGLPAGLLPYAGAGLGVGLNREVDDAERDTDGFARVPVGVAWYSRRMPLGVFAEVAPSVVVTPDAEGYVDTGVGARYYF